MMEKLLYSLGIILIGLVLGYILQILINRGILRPRRSSTELRKLLQYFAILILYPIALIGAIWIVDWCHLEVAVLPLVGFFSLLFGGILAYAFSVWHRLDREQTGVFILCGAITNVGAIGALICYAFLGEVGFALVSFYNLLEGPFNYCIGFPLAKFFSTSGGPEQSVANRIKSLLLDPFLLVSLASIFLGFILNIYNIPRPQFYAAINAFIIPVVSFLLLVSVGMSIKIKGLKPYLRLGFTTVLIKFLLVPTVTVGLGILLGLEGYDQGLPLKVVLILSSMPTGFIALVPPTIYDLDVDLANTCWLVSTACLLWVVPIQYFIIQFI